MNTSVLLLISVLYLVRGETSDDEAMEILKKCSKNNGTDIAQIVLDYYEFKLPEKDEDFCLLACVLKESGIIHDGKYDADLAYEENEEVYAPESLAKANEIEKNCVTEVGTTVDDECQFTKKYLTCIAKQAKTANLKFREDA